MAVARMQRGVTMIEALITIFIVAIGLLGIASLQGRMQLAELEAYQRAQATVLLRHVTDRINANRKNAMSYVTSSPLGAGQGIQNCSQLSGAALDLCEWNNLLAGAAENAGSDYVGAMIGARGCIFNTDPAMPRKFLIAVVWQGLTPTAATPDTTCGSGTYADDRLRRAVVAPITLACLQNDINTGLCTTP